MLNGYEMPEHIDQLFANEKKASAEIKFEARKHLSSFIHKRPNPDSLKDGIVMRKGRMDVLGGGTMKHKIDWAAKISPSMTPEDIKESEQAYLEYVSGLDRGDRPWEWDI